MLNLFSIMLRVTELTIEEIVHIQSKIEKCRNSTRIMYLVVYVDKLNFFE